MKPVRCKKEDKSWSDLFQRKLQQIECMKPYVNEPEIFNFDSPKFKEFVIHAFTNLRPEFHYLSYLNSDHVDQELLKVAGILQILPTHLVKKNKKLFDNWTEPEIYRFWARFFSLFHTNVSEQFSTENVLPYEYKTNFFKDVNSTAHYFNYDFPIINVKKVMDVNLNDEILHWGKKSPVDVETTVNESTVHTSDADLSFNINAEKLITDLKYALTVYDNFKISPEKFDHCETKQLHNFINLMKDVVLHKTNLDIINSNAFANLLSEKYMKVEHQDELSKNLYFLKNFINHINVLNSKIKQLL